MTEEQQDTDEKEQLTKKLSLQDRIARLTAEIEHRQKILAEAPVVEKTISSPQECPWREKRLRLCEKCKEGKREESKLEPSPVRIIYNVELCYSEIQYQRLVEKSGLVGVELSHLFENADLDEHNSDLFEFLQQWDPRSGGGIYITSKRNGINPTGNGVGKSYALHALTHRLCRMGVPCLFARTIDFKKQLQGFKDDDYEGEYRILKRYANIPVLLWDDLGKEYFKTDWGCEKFFYVIDYRVRTNKPIVISSNFGLKEIAARFGDSNFGSAIASRLAGFCRIWSLGGPDRRFLDQDEKKYLNGKEGTKT
jgi:DNA replication protein DnaC